MYVTVQSNPDLEPVLPLICGSSSSQRASLFVCWLYPMACPTIRPMQGGTSIDSLGVEHEAYAGLWSDNATRRELGSDQDAPCHGDPQ